jgi:hypothetical protein
MKNRWGMRLTKIQQGVSGAETKTKGGAECLLIHELREGFLAGVPLCSHEGKSDLGEQKMPWLGSTLGEKNQILHYRRKRREQARAND